MGLNQRLFLTLRQIGGKGGGRPDIAQAGGSQPERLDEVLKGAFGILG